MLEFLRYRRCPEESPREACCCFIVTSFFYAFASTITLMLGSYSAGQFSVQQLWPATAYRAAIQK